MLVSGTHFDLDHDRGKDAGLRNHPDLLAFASLMDLDHIHDGARCALATMRVVDADSIAPGEGLGEHDLLDAHVAARALAVVVARQSTAGTNRCVSVVDGFELRVRDVEVRVNRAVLSRQNS